MMVDGKLRIAAMLRGQGKHLSFHTPGHKRRGADITELVYSDCLLSPHGVLKEAEEDIARLLGAARSFLLTDGSTCGVFSMLYALRASGRRRVAAPAFSHSCVRHACEVLGLDLLPIGGRARFGVPLQPSAEELARALKEADALLLTSPDYYGNFPALPAVRTLCTGAGKPLLLDGAHGAHLRFSPLLYAGSYADMWVDGAHKSLPALTQGAVVSAKTAEWADLLAEGVKRFRTTSPSYPIMASVEYAVKYPQNRAIEEAAKNFKLRLHCYPNADWSKLLIPFGENCDNAERYLESRGVYPEFNDGNYLMFYLSPCVKLRALKKLGKLVARLPRGTVAEDAPSGAIPMYREELR